MAQLMPLPLAVSCFSKIQIGFTFLVPAYLGSPGKGPLNGCVSSVELLLQSARMKCHNTEKEKKYLKIHGIKKYDATQIIGKNLVDLLIKSTSNKEKANQKCNCDKLASSGMKQKKGFGNKNKRNEHVAGDHLVVLYRFRAR